MRTHLPPSMIGGVLDQIGDHLPLAQRMLLQAARDFGVGVSFVLPGRVPEVPPKTVCLVDDGSLTRQLMGLPDDGPDGFDRPTLDRLLRSARVIAVNGCEQHPTTTATVVRDTAAAGGRGVLIETEPKNFLAWVERVKQLRYRGPKTGWAGDLAALFVVPDGIEMPILPPMRSLGRVKPAEEGPPGPDDYRVVREWPAASDA